MEQKIIDLDMADIIDLEYELLLAQSEAQTPRLSLDETTAHLSFAPANDKWADVSGGLPSGSNPLGIKLSDLSLNKTCVDGYTTMYAFTFTYDPKVKHIVTEQIQKDYITVEDDEAKFWSACLLKPAKKHITKEFGNFPFLMQYKIFVKHFNKWLKEMSTLLDQRTASAIVGYTVCIEQTKAGLLHAHGMIYSNNSYKDMFASTSRTLWAQISKGRVVAMQKAFEAASNEKSWKKYVTKDLEKKL